LSSTVPKKIKINSYLKIRSEKK